MTLKHLDSLRQACGGAGFSAHSGLPYLVTEYAPHTIVEGMNDVMAQQSARFLMKNIKNVAAGKQPVEALAYLNMLSQANELRCKARAAADMRRLEVVEDALRARALQIC